MEEARAFILNRFKQSGEYGFLPEGVLEKMINSLIELDDHFMKETGVEDGAEYDDDKAFDMLFKGMTAAFAEHRMYMMRLCEDYLDYNEEYLESIGAIEWN